MNLLPKRTAFSIHEYRNGVRYHLLVSKGICSSRVSKTRELTHQSIAQYGFLFPATTFQAWDNSLFESTGIRLYFNRHFP